MTLTRARVIFATGGFGELVTTTVRSILTVPVDRGALADEVLSMRKKLEAGRPRRHLKRGPGGLADVEFAVQYLQLLHGAGQPDLLRSNMWEALAALKRRRIISSEVWRDLTSAYDFLRTVEGRLRLIHDRYVSEIPEDRGEIERMAPRLSDEALAPARAVESFLGEADSRMKRTREIFEEIVSRAVTE